MTHISEFLRDAHMIESEWKREKRKARREVYLFWAFLTVELAMLSPFVYSAISFYSK